MEIVTACVCSECRQETSQGNIRTIETVRVTVSGLCNSCAVLPRVLATQVTPSVDAMSGTEKRQTVIDLLEAMCLAEKTPYLVVTALQMVEFAVTHDLFKYHPLLKNQYTLGRYLGIMCRAEDNAITLRSATGVGKYCFVPNHARRIQGIINTGSDITVNPEAFVNVPK